MRYDTDLKKINSTKCQQIQKNVAAGHRARSHYCWWVWSPPTHSLLTSCFCLVFTCCQSKAEAQTGSRRKTDWHQALLLPIPDLPVLNVNKVKHWGEAQAYWGVLQHTHSFLRLGVGWNLRQLRLPAVHFITSHSLTSILTRDVFKISIQGYIVAGFFEIRASLRRRQYRYFTCNK